MMHYLISKALVCKNRTVLLATHTRIMPAFTPQPQRQSVIALWLLLIAPIHEGWPG